MLVRVQSKLEPPLITLRGVRGGGLVISTLADVTFYGRDQTGTEVSVKGTISVNFADWADPELTGGWRLLTLRSGDRSQG